MGGQQLVKELNGKGSVVVFTMPEQMGGQRHSGRVCLP